MKKHVIIALLFTATIFTGCLEDLEENEYTTLSYKRVPIEQVNIPNELIRGENTEITVSYFKPSDCHSFSGFDYDRVSNERTISVINVILDNPDCEDLGQTIMVTKDYKFLVGSENSYIFRFWQGKDSQGNNQFLIIEVPVIDGV